MHVLPLSVGVLRFPPTIQSDTNRFIGDTGIVLYVCVCVCDEYRRVLAVLTFADPFSRCYNETFSVPSMHFRRSAVLFDH